MMVSSVFCQAAREDCETLTCFWQQGKSSDTLATVHMIVLLSYCIKPDTVSLQRAMPLNRKAGRIAGVTAYG